MRRVLLAESINLPGYNRVALHRSQICLADDIHLVERDYTIGIGISYKKLLTQTINRIALNIAIHDSEQPLKVRISDGLDGLGSHRVYQQVTSHPDVTTKKIILFGFKEMSKSDSQKNTLWKNCLPNSPFSIRPVTILTLTENKENVSFLMKTMINNETDDIEASGLDLINSYVSILLQQLYTHKMAPRLVWMSVINSSYCVGIVDSTQYRKSFSLLFFRIKHRLATFPVVDVPPCEEAKSIMISNFSFSIHKENSWHLGLSLN